MMAVPIGMLAFDRDLIGRHADVGFTRRQYRPRRTYSPIFSDALDRGRASRPSRTLAMAAVAASQYRRCRCRRRAPPQCRAILAVAESRCRREPTLDNRLGRRPTHRRCCSHRRTEPAAAAERRCSWPRSSRLLPARRRRRTQPRPNHRRSACWPYALANRKRDAAADHRGSGNEAERRIGQMQRAAPPAVKPAGPSP